MRLLTNVPCAVNAVIILFAVDFDKYSTICRLGKATAITCLCVNPAACLHLTCGSLACLHACVCMCIYVCRPVFVPMAVWLCTPVSVHGCLSACVGKHTCSLIYTPSPNSSYLNSAHLAGANASLIQNFFGSTGTANASFTAAVSASSPWCMQRCSSSDCGDAGLDSSIVLSSICDERLGQMWYNQSGTIRSRLNDECITICGISTAEARASKGNTSLAASCLGKGSDYYNIETSVCSGAPNQLWEWVPMPAGSVLFNKETSQAIKVCSDLEPWCGFLLLLTFDATWSARRLTAVRLPTNLSDTTAFQTFNAAVPTKAQASSSAIMHLPVTPLSRPGCLVQHLAHCSEQVSQSPLASKRTGCPAFQLLSRQTRPSMPSV